MTRMKSGGEEKGVLWKYSVFKECEFLRVLESTNGEIDNEDNFSAVITYIAKYGVSLTVSNVDKAIIHNIEIFYARNQSLKRGQTINARLIGENEKAICNL